MGCDRWPEDAGGVGVGVMGYDPLKDPDTKGQKFLVRDLIEDGPCVYRHYARPNGNVGTYVKKHGPFATVDAAKRWIAENGLNAKGERDARSQ